MSNTYFQFKEFTVHQEKVAMKVCTDACLFGAWVVDTLMGQNQKIESVLDIGAGTGLLSLMIAQKIAAKIVAIEIDEEAATQAKENFNPSKYAGSLQLIKGDVRALTVDNKFDLVISNPPFFKDDLKSDDQKRNLALHSDALDFEELILLAKKALTAEGAFAVLLPFFRSDHFVQLAMDQNLFLKQQMLVKQTEKHGYFRSMLLFTGRKTQIQTSEMIIKNEGKYSEEFIRLLKDYYLYL